ncbi:MAG: Trm112 family protein [Pseudomonadota bacterium]
MDKKLLSILCCPVTHRDLTLVKPEALSRLNVAISEGKVSNREGAVLTETIDEALVTNDGKILYPVSDGIPVLLEGESIAAEDFV